MEKWWNFCMKMAISHLDRIFRIFFFQNWNIHPNIDPHTDFGYAKVNIDHFGNFNFPMKKWRGNVIEIIKYLIRNALFSKNFFRLMISLQKSIAVPIFNFQNQILDIFGKWNFFFFHGNYLTKYNGNDDFFHDEIWILRKFFLWIVSQYVVENRFARCQTE